MGKFLKRHKLPKLIAINIYDKKEIKFVFKNIPTKETLVPDSSTVNLIK